jgi:hypothetical protein
MVKQFSDAWHLFFTELEINPPEARNMLKDIEDQLAVYMSFWNEHGPYPLSPFEKEKATLESTVERLNFVNWSIGLLERVILVRSIHLIGAFIDSINRDDFDSAPFLLRAVMEEAALGVHAHKKIGEGLQALRDGKPNAIKLLSAAMFSNLFGAKLNYGSILEELERRRNVRGDFDWDTQEVPAVLDSIEKGRLSEKEIRPEDLKWRTRSIAEMIDDMDAEAHQPGDPPKAIRMKWEYLSQYCHPSGFAWSFNQSEVFMGSQEYTAADHMTDLRLKATSCLIEPMWDWIVNLPAGALERLTNLSAEVEREAQALGRRQ